MVKRFLLNYLKIYFNKTKRSKKSLIIFILSILAITTSILISTFLYLEIPNIPPVNDQMIIKTVFSLISGLYLFFIFIPITGLSMRGEDPSMLLKYPISYMDAFLIETIKSTTNIWFLSLFGPPIISIFLLISSNPLHFLIGVIGYILFVLHAAGIGYIVFSLIQGLFEDRKFRDIIGILIGSIGILIYIAIYLLPEFIPLTEILDITYSTHIFLPSGWLISIISEKQILFIIPLFIIFSLTLLAGKYSFKYSYYVSIEKRNKKEKKKRRSLKLPISRELNALINKELKYYFRDTNLKISLISSMIFVIIFGLQPYFQSGTFNNTNLSYLGTFAGFFFSFSFLNYLGYERDGIFKLLYSPIKRKNIIAIKNLLLAAIFLTYILILLISLNILLKAPLSFKFLAISISTFLIILSVTNNTGVRFPQKMPKELRGGKNASIIGVILSFLFSGILMTPIFLYFFPEILILLSIPQIPIYLILIYATTVYLIGLKIASDYLRNNETKILEKFNED